MFYPFFLTCISWFLLFLLMWLNFHAKISSKQDASVCANEQFCEQLLLRRDILVVVFRLTWRVFHCSAISADPFWEDHVERPAPSLNVFMVYAWRAPSAKRRVWELRCTTCFLGGQAITDGATDSEAFARYTCVKWFVILYNMDPYGSVWFYAVLYMESKIVSAHLVWK